MNDTQTKQLKEIEALLGERRTFEEWLAQLESHRESTPPHVFLKVQADYRAKLEEAQGKLSSKTDAVRTLVTGLESSLLAQDLAIGAKGDERSEAGVRAAVGEYGTKEWDKRRAALDAAIGLLQAERAAVQRELEKLQALLAGAVPGSAPASPAEKGAPVDEVAFLRSILGRSTPQHTPLPPTASAAVPEHVPPATEAEDSVTHESARAAEPPPEESKPAREPARVTPLSMPADQARESGAYPRASRSFGGPTPKTSEAQKSLTCSACGALNFPTEWYCEKCGGELAAF